MIQGMSLPLQPISIPVTGSHSAATAAAGSVSGYSMSQNGDRSSLGIRCRFQTRKTPLAAATAARTASSSNGCCWSRCTALSVHRGGRSRCSRTSRPSGSRTWLTSMVLAANFEGGPATRTRVPAARIFGSIPCRSRRLGGVVSSSHSAPPYAGSACTQ